MQAGEHDQVLERNRRRYNAYLDLVFPEGVPDELKDAMGALGQRLEEIAEKMAESLQTL